MDKEPEHYLPQWADKRGLSQAEIVRLTGVDRATVSRWFSGVLPKHKNRLLLAAALKIEQSDLLKPPPEDLRMSVTLPGGSSSEIYEDLYDIAAENVERWLRLEGLTVSFEKRDKMILSEANRLKKAIKDDILQKSTTGKIENP